MTDQVIAPMPALRGTIRPPGDKSLTHRGLIIGAMTDGLSTLEDAAVGADISSSMDCLRRLGVDVRQEGSELRVTGGWGKRSSASLDAGNSGTTMRLLMGALAGVPGTFDLVGDESLTRRPMRRVAEPLEKMGCSIELSPEGTAPVRIGGAALQAISYQSVIASAQIKGAILLAGLQARGRTEVVESAQSRDHTERILAWLGGDVFMSATAAGVEGGCLPLPEFRLKVPGDISSAAFFIAAAALLPGSEIEVEGVGLNPTRTGFLDILGDMGADIQTRLESADPEPQGTVTVRSSNLVGTQIGGEIIATTIDELPLIGLAATQADGETFVADAGELRVKETDRIAVLTEGLRQLGADIEETKDGFNVRGPTKLTGGVVSAAGDHRLALTFAVAGWIASEPVTIGDWESIAVSYPSFLSDAERLSR